MTYDWNSQTTTFTDGEVIDKVMLSGGGISSAVRAGLTPSHLTAGSLLTETVLRAQEAVTELSMIDAALKALHMEITDPTTPDYEG